MVVLTLRVNTGRERTTSPLPTLPSEICQILQQYLPPRDAFSLGTVCLDLRVNVASFDYYWKHNLHYFQDRLCNSVPFYDWCYKESSSAAVQMAWSRLRVRLVPTQRSSLLPPVSYRTVKRIEKTVQLVFPLDVIFSFTQQHNGQASTRCQGSQLLAGEFFMLSCEDIPVVTRTQRERGLQLNYLPLFVNSSHQKCVCSDVTSGKIYVWSPLFEAQWAVSWSAFLEPE
jgi:hypothetical protein|tara:strand:+ start:294 stop:977 length:684 start_codon:yes stop_codon:yes gene_type:complete